MRRGSEVIAFRSLAEQEKLCWGACGQTTVALDRELRVLGLKGRRTSRPSGALGACGRGEGKDVHGVARVRGSGHVRAGVRNEPATNWRLFQVQDLLIQSHRTFPISGER